MGFRTGCFMVVLGLLPAFARAQGAAPELIEVRKIWDAAPHNAFTDLVRFGDGWLCVFREGSAHVPGIDGKIRVLRSADGRAWESAALVVEEGVDLRDPKVSVAPDGRLMLLMGGSVYGGAAPTPNRKIVSAHTRVSFSKDAREWSAPRPVTGVGDNQWLWRVTWHKGVGYGTAYGAAADGKGGQAMSLWKTADGVAYERLADPSPPVRPTEATARFLADDTMVILLRGEAKDRHAWIATAKPPYEKFEWRDGGHSAHGPNFIVTAAGAMWYAGRDFMEKGAAKTVFGRMTAERLEPLITLPSGGDTSYPGLAEAGGGVIFVSYYASHEGKAAIYLAKIQVGAK